METVQTNIPLVDLKAQYVTIKDEIDTAVASVIEETAFVRGHYVRTFEQEYARAYGVSQCVSVGNGTDALYIALKILGVGPGDEVITTAHTWISSSETITQTGARVVFVDCESDYFTIDPTCIEEKITDRTKAIVAVHLYGQPVALNAVRSLCSWHGLFLIEDCAQAHFAEYKGQRVGTIGDIGTFSFYPGKNLGAYGDGGALITNSEEYAQKIRMYANHGSLVKHEHETEGINSRLDGLQAAILSVKLKYILEWNALRSSHARLYTELLSTCSDVITPAIRQGNNHVFHLYVLRVRRRDELKQFLHERGVQTGIHYPKALPFLKAYAYLGHTPNDFPVAFEMQQDIVSLPLYPELTHGQIVYVTDAIKAFYTRG